MLMSDQTPCQAPEGLGISTAEFIAYCDCERERRLSSGEPFDQELRKMDDGPALRKTADSLDRIWNLITV